MKRHFQLGVLGLTLIVSLAIHAGLFLWGKRVPLPAAKHLIAIQVVEKKAIPKVLPHPKVLVRRYSKNLRSVGRKPGIRSSGGAHTPPKFGVSKANANGDMALPEGNSLIADPQATPEPIAPSAPTEEQETFISSSECDSPPVPTAAIEPVYPDFAKTGHIEGKVILELDIDSQGNVVDIRVLKSAHPSLKEAAIQAVRGIRFQPAVKDGLAVAVTMRYPFTFSLTP
jgi:TonB family protein